MSLKSRVWAPPAVPLWVSNVQKLEQKTERKETGTRRRREEVEVFDVDDVGDLKPPLYEDLGLVLVEGEILSDPVNQWRLRAQDVQVWAVYKERMSAEVENLAIVKNRLQREVRGLERALEPASSLIHRLPPEVSTKKVEVSTRRHSVKSMVQEQKMS